MGIYSPQKVSQEDVSVTDKGGALPLSHKTSGHFKLLSFSPNHAVQRGDTAEALPVLPQVDQLVPTFLRPGHKVSYFLLVKKVSRTLC